MDELEISGKRYISAKRAGKENKYHPDYIGQLIRAGKVEGQKVGRAWYVVADSLSTYLAKEPGTASVAAAPKKQIPKLVVEEVVEEAPVQESVAEEALEAEEIKEEPVEEVEEEKAEEVPIKKVVQKIPEPPKPQAIKITKVEVVKPASPEEAFEYQIPVKISSRGGLRYMQDDEPLFPAIKKTKEQPMAHVQVMPRQPVKVKEEVYEEPERVTIVERPKVKKNLKKRAPIVRAGAVLVIGGIVFGLCALISTHLISTTTVKEGQPASVGYAIQ